MQDPTHNIYNSQRMINVYSINYDFVPSSTYRDKVLWIVTDYVPSDLRIGQYVKLVSDIPEMGFPNTTLQIEDIEGKRIILSTKLVPKSVIRAGGNLRYYGKQNAPKWTPLNRAPHWGNTTRDFTYLPGQYRNWQYGYGNAIGYLIY